MRQLFFAIIASVFCTSTALCAGSLPGSTKQYYVVTYYQGEAWIPGKHWYEQDLAAHGQYMSDLFVKRKLVLGGPFNDDSGGQAVLDVATGQEAEAIVRNDPAVVTGIFAFQIKAWFIGFERTP